jgi:hypothetical protein
LVYRRRGIKADSSWASSGSYQPDGIQKASVAIFIVYWALVVFLTLHTLRRGNGASSKTQKIAIGAFEISLPLLAVRTACSAISIFGNPRSFSSIYGNVTIMLCMALVEEATVVLMYEGLGFMTLEAEKRARSVDTELSTPGIEMYPRK